MRKELHLTYFVCLPTSQYTDRVNPADKHVVVLAEQFGISPAPITPQMFAGAGKEYMAKYGMASCVHNVTMYD